MTILLSDPRVAAVPLRETGEPMVELSENFGPVRATVRVGLATRLLRAQSFLPRGLHLRVVEGHRSPQQQRAIIETYTAQVRAAHPGASERDLPDLVARFVAPLAVAPHVAGAAVDLSMVDEAGVALDLGTPVDATPEQSRGACFFDSPWISSQARAHRRLMAAALNSAGLVNYPTEWWHWSYGDRYWALTTGAPSALYGPAGSADPADPEGAA
ncbi:M15 family metallopeptidase [Kineosporia sp. NBRC 101731]|uniref:M15 family metallopeptidase n=1 Tax=Kineosporia sp. NBRC 101731 TaxID=3032199 RepID=UPI0025544F9C|nr:M15 family metallopeptidase [Kineosporia sp. NBRC 101731]